MQDFQPDSALQLGMYREMLNIRRFEERWNYLFMQDAHDGNDLKAPSWLISQSVQGPRLASAGR